MRQKDYEANLGRRLGRQDKELIRSWSQVPAQCDSCLFAGNLLDFQGVPHKSHLSCPECGSRELRHLDLSPVPEATQ